MAVGPLPPEPPPPPPVWLLPISVSLFGVSMFLLYQSAAFLKWATKDETDAPNPRTGIGLAWGLTAGIVFGFHFQAIDAMYLASEYDFKTSLPIFLSSLFLFPFWDPETFSQALLFASLPVGILAVYKFFMVAALARSSQAPTLVRSPMAVLAGGIFGLVQLAGSIASLYAVFRQ